MALGLSQEQIPVCLTTELLVAICNISEIMPTECSVIPQQQIKKKKKKENWKLSIATLNNAVSTFLLAPLFSHWIFLLQA